MMENTIVTGVAGTSRSTLPTLPAGRLRASGPVAGNVEGRGDLGHGAPLPIFDPTQDVTTVRTP